MSMELHISDVLGIHRAMVPLEPGQVTEVIGPNASGKTSIAVAAQAVLAANPNPLALPGTDTKRYLREGGEDSWAALRWLERTGHEGEPTEFEVVWRPDPQTITAPTDVQATHPSAVGITNWVQRGDAKGRMIMLQEALLPTPAQVLEQTRETLERYLNAADLKGVMDMLAELDWEATAKVYADRAKEGKRNWTDVTGRNWGVRVASDWLPDNWLADWDQLTVQMAEERVQGARDALDLLHREQAISEADLQAAEDAKAQLPTLEAEVSDLRAVYEAKNERRLELNAVLDRTINHSREAAGALSAARADKDAAERALERERQNPSLTCPHCDNAVVYVDGVLSSFDEDEWQQRIGDREAAVATALGKIPDLVNAASNANSDVEHARENLSEAEGEQADAETAWNDKRASRDALNIAARRTGVVKTAESDAHLREAEQAVDDAKEVVTAVTKRRQAKQLHESIVRYLEVAKALGPEGVRAKMLADGLAGLNAGLEVLSGLTTWPEMRVTERGAVYWADRPVALCSESEQWRAQASIQLTLGALTGAKVVVLDRADLLDQFHREKVQIGLVHVAERTGMAVLLCSTGTPGTPPWRQIVVADGLIDGSEDGE